jgi:hypothetical protein
MNRRFTAVLVIAAASFAPVAFAARKQEAAPAAKTAAAKPVNAESLAKVAPLVPVSLAALFAYNDTVTKTESGMLIAEPNIIHVMVIKTGPEGMPERACTDNAETAAAWLDKAALENLARTTPTAGKDQ